MQSMPPYYQQQAGGYQTQSPYQTPGAPASNVLNNGPAMLNHPNGLPPMQHPGLADQTQNSPSTQAPKRKQVKNACTNCQKACKKCDDARPCPRCIKYGIADTCVNSVRKERKKGIKRGPYKRRQKSESDKSRKTELSTDQNGQPSQYAPSMRGPTMPFGYPSNLNQYGQPYDPYGQYAAYQKTEPMMHQPYVVNSVYPPMGYPVIVPGATGENSQQQQTQQQQQQHPYQHYNNMMQQHSPQTARPPMMHNEHVMHQQSPSGSPQTQVYYQQQPQQQQQHSQPPSQRSSPHLNDVKNEQHNEGFVKPQPMTPVPSTSTSTATTSSPDSGIHYKEDRYHGGY
ncbi:hypothetical protein K501DRAFT_177150 [Backusella circina FSU 941]|nr:hypothetical protein K501DRAFT_177150 [Backusella circina FSU 941]